MKGSEYDFNRRDQAAHDPTQAYQFVFRPRQCCRNIDQTKTARSEVKTSDDRTLTHGDNGHNGHSGHCGHNGQNGHYGHHNYNKK